MGQCPAGQPNAMPRFTPIAYPVILVLLSAGLFIAPLFFFDIVGFNEAQDGLRLSAFVSADDGGVGRWLFPSVRKPPLFYWLGSIVVLLRDGAVDALSARLPSALLAGCGVFMLVWLGRLMASPAAGRLAAFTLLTAPLYVEYARMARPDMALCFFVSLSLGLFFLAHTHAASRQSRSAAWLPLVPYGFALCLLGAVFSKGPLGAILVGLPILAFAVWRRELAPFRSLCRAGPVLLVLVLGLGWYAGAVWWQPHHFWSTQIVEENLGRFLGGIDVMSPFYYLDVIFLRFAPWSVFLPIAVWQAFRSRQDGPVFVALWWTTITVFFHLAAYKRARYLLPMFPPAALLIGWWLSTSTAKLAAQCRDWSWWRPLMRLVCVALLMVMCLGLSILASSQSEHQTACRLALAVFPHRTAAQPVQYCQWLSGQLGLGLSVWAAFGLAVSGVLFTLQRARLAQAFGFAVASLVVFHGLIQPSWLMIESRARFPRAVVQQVVQHTHDHGQVFVIRPLTTAQDPDVAAIFHIQQAVRVRDLRWPPQQPPAALAAGYYLVPTQRKPEILSYPHGQWQEKRIEKAGRPWTFVLLRYRPDSERPVSLP